MGFPPPPNFPAPGAVVPELPAEICPVLPLPALSFSLKPKLNIPGINIGGGGDASIDGELDFPLGARAVPCGFCIALPKWKLKLNIPGFKFPPDIPLPFLSLKLSCDLAFPIDVSAGISFGGGRTSKAPTDPDLSEGP